jgi:hypothetical protein
MLDQSEEMQSQLSGYTGHTSTERFKAMLGEQLQINEKLEIENEKKSIQIRKMLSLLKSS